MAKQQKAHAVRGKCYAVKINASNDNNGNPRRGWLVYATTGEYKGFVDEGYLGRGALRLFAPGAIPLAEIPTSPGFYRDVTREGWPS